jgi:MoxR-like ATPase
MLARAIAGSIEGATTSRIQCTPDLQPTDVTGLSIFDQKSREFEFRAGPVFANVVLVDEVNRASPRTQAALLEPMEERQVTIDGVTHALPEPFFVVATQNPAGAAGTFPLPESQLDRFSIVCTIGLPARDAEREILSGRGGPDVLDDVHPVTTPSALADAIQSVREVHCAASVIDYVLDVAAATRSHPEVLIGASPRASLGLLHCAQAHATVAGRDFVSPDDVKAVAPHALAHRIVLTNGVDTPAAMRVLHEIVSAVATPRP